MEESQAIFHHYDNELQLILVSTGLICDCYRTASIRSRLQAEIILTGALGSGGGLNFDVLGGKPQLGGQPPAYGAGSTVFLLSKPLQCGRFIYLTP